MTWEWILWAASAALMWGYIGLMIVRHGMASVVSEYAYRGRMWAFSLCLGGAAVLLMPVLVELAPEWGKMLGFGAAAALCFVAAAPHYKEEESRVHNVAAAVAGALGVAWTLGVEPMAVAGALLFWLVMGTATRKWWLMAEIGGLLMVYAAAMARITLP